MDTMTRPYGQIQKLSHLQCFCGLGVPAKSLSCHDSLPISPKPTNPISCVLVRMVIVFLQKEITNANHYVPRLWNPVRNGKRGCETLC